MAELEKEKKSKEGSQSKEQKREAPRASSYSEGGSSQGGYGIFIALGIAGCLLMIPFLSKKGTSLE